jgi:outer membrane protein TolC
MQLFVARIASLTMVTRLDSSPAGRLMPLRKHFCLHICVACALLFGVIPAKVLALQPLDTFVRAARRANHSNREAEATTTQRDAEAQVAKAGLYPVFTAAGTYTRNQYEVALVLPEELGGTGDRLVIQPRNQLDGTLTLRIPVIDIGLWKRISAAKAGAEASSASQLATEQDVETQVYRSYYQLLGQEAVLEASKRTLGVAQKNLQQVQDQVELGTASELDVQRARAEIARAEGDVASANFAVVTARRQLATTTTIEPEPATEFIDDDLHQEKPLETWLSSSGSTPAVTVANASRRAADASAEAARAAWYPTLSASAQERFTNATSFSGHAAVYSLQATLAWQFDGTLSPTVRAQAAAANTSLIRAEYAERAAQDAIFQAWHQVHAAIEKSRAARSQIDAAKTAAELASDRYSLGAATQLEVVQAQQDAFRAVVARIQADTELAYARAALRASSGQFGERGKP